MVSFSWLKNLGCYFNRVCCNYKNLIPEHEKGLIMK